VSSLEITFFHPTLQSMIDLSLMITFLTLFKIEMLQIYAVLASVESKWS
jgi:hypothetical protein